VAQVVMKEFNKVKCNRLQF